MEAAAEAALRNANLADLREGIQEEPNAIWIKDSDKPDSKINARRR